jgi:hypothetical protein
MLKILKGTDEVIKKNLDVLAKDYLEKTGRKVCRTCPSDIAYMILSLKNIYKMTVFSFKKERAQYKNKKGDKVTISNSTMTDAKAIEFLKENPKRIELFKVFPKNWKKLIKGEAETEDQKETRLAIEAELAIAEKAKKEKGAKKEEKVLKVVKNEDETEEEKETRLAAEALKGRKNELLKMKLSELREKYPEIKATSIKDFVGQVLNLK